jgi:hypothetical protein
MNNLEKEFVSYQEASALKELGFDKPCFTWYWDDIGLYSDFIYGNHNKNPNLISAPTYSQAFRWFREKYGLSGFTLPWGEGLFDYRIYSTKEGLHLFSSPKYSSTEEAELACLKKLIEIVKANPA